MASIESVTSDMEATLTGFGYVTGIENLWVPEHGWSRDNTEAGVNPFAPQYLAALQIFAWMFGEANKSWIHLAAEMQAGKTGVINALIRLMLILPNFKKIQTKSDNIFIITGMNDNSWKKQTKDRMPENIHKNIHHLKGLDSVMSQFSKCSEDDFKNILVVLDESHIASDVSNLPATVFEQMRVRAGGVEKWAEKNIRLVTISATDPASIIGVSEHVSMARVVNLRTSDNYQSVEKLRNTNRIHSTINLKSEEDIGRMLNIVQTTFPDTPNLYHIIRVPPRSKKGLIPDTIKKLLSHCDVIEWDAESNTQRDESLSSSDSTCVKDINEILEREPVMPTFVLIKNMFYAAKTLNDTYCGILFDRSSAKDDTNLQSLLGRACGYGKNTQTHVYTSLTTVQNYIDVWSRVRPTDNMVIPDVPAHRLHKKMAGVDVVPVEGGANLVLSHKRAIAVTNDGRGRAQPVRSTEKFRISEQVFDNVSQAKSWANETFVDTYKSSELRLNRETMTFQYRGKARDIRSEFETRQLNDLGWGISRTGSARIMPVLVGDDVKYIVVYKPEFLK